MLAECRALKDRVDEERCCEIRERDPGGPPGRRPQVVALVDEEEQDHQRDGKPLVAQGARDRTSAVQQVFADPTSGASRQHERAGHAEEVAGQQERQDDEAAVVQPYADGGQVLGCKLRPYQAIEDDPCGEQSEWNLHGKPRMPPLQKPAGDRPREDVDGAMFWIRSHEDAKLPAAWMIECKNDRVTCETARQGWRHQNHRLGANAQATKQRPVNGAYDAVTGPFSPRKWAARIQRALLGKPGD